MRHGQGRVRPSVRVGGLGDHRGRGGGGGGGGGVSGGEGGEASHTVGDGFEARRGAQVATARGGVHRAGAHAPTGEVLPETARAGRGQGGASVQGPLPVAGSLEARVEDRSSEDAAISDQRSGRGVLGQTRGGAGEERLHPHSEEVAEVGAGARAHFHEVALRAVDERTRNGRRIRSPRHGARQEGRVRGDLVHHVALVAAAAIAAIRVLPQSH